MCFGVTAGAIWEVVEWFIVMGDFADSPVSDIVWDSLGALAAGGLSVWFVKRSAFPAESRQSATRFAVRYRPAGRALVGGARRGSAVFDLIVGFVKASGYFGIALLMLLENLFPPIPSELIMPLAGFAAASGELDLRLVVLAGAVGSTAGAIFWYGVGRCIGKERLKRFAARNGRWLTLDPAGIDRAEAWFRRYAGAAVFLGRLVPAVRTLISVPAGIAEMPVGRFVACSAVGTAIWSGFLASAGYMLESRYQQLSSFLNVGSNGVTGLLLAWYLYRLVAFKPKGTS